MEDQRLVKTVMLGMVEGDRPRGRPQEDDADWCGFTIPEAVRLANDRQRVEMNHWPRRPTRRGQEFPRRRRQKSKKVERITFLSFKYCKTGAVDVHGLNAQLYSLSVLLYRSTKLSVPDIKQFK